MPQSTYQERRRHFAAKMQPNSIAFLATNKVARRNNDNDYRYRADSSFFYLTGFTEPKSALVLTKDVQGEVRYHLFVRGSDAEAELWHGRRAGLAGAKEKYAADEAYDISEINRELPKLMLGKQVMYCRLADSGFKNTLFARSVDKWLSRTARLKRGDGVPSQLVDINPMLYEMRLVKLPLEIAQMKTAAKISAEAHKRAMQRAHVGMMEYTLEAELLYVMQKAGCREAYGSIVAGGSNACILHYTDNKDTLAEGDLVLIDAGAEYQYYAADITRTFPVSGRFSEPQKVLYNIVLEAQYAAMTELKVGKLSRDYHRAAVKSIVTGLVHAGLLTGEVDELIEAESYKAFFMHGTGHWLGLDVHDVGSYHEPSDMTKERVLQAGMVVTVEPGIYVAPDNTDVPAEYRGIGIRIEDDVLITEHEPEVLTKDVPKTIEAIEALMAQGRG